MLLLWLLNWNETEQKSSWNLLRLLPDFKPTQIILLVNFNKYGGLFVKHFLPYSPSAPQCSNYSKRCMGNEVVWRAAAPAATTKKSSLYRAVSVARLFNAIQYYRNGDINWRVCCRCIGAVLPSEYLRYIARSRIHQCRFQFPPYQNVRSSNGRCSMWSNFGYT